MYARYTTKEKLKRISVSVLYAMFLLAEVGELFVYIKQPQTIKEKQAETEVRLELPEHVPEAYREAFSDQPRVCYLISNSETKEG